MEGRAQKGWKGPLYLSRPRRRSDAKSHVPGAAVAAVAGPSFAVYHVAMLKSTLRNPVGSARRENKEGDQVWGLLSDSAPSLHLHREIHNATDRERQGECDPTYKIGLHIGTGEITIGVQSR